MILIAILTAVFLYGLFVGRIAALPLWVLSIGAGAALGIMSRHEHDGTITIDALAQTSRLHAVNPSLKLWTVLLTMILCIASTSPWTGVVLAVAMLLLTVAGGGIRLHDYLHLMALPLSFLLLSGLALLVSFAPEPEGIVSIGLFGGYLNLTAQAQQQTMLVIGRALGAVSCLYLLSLSTPMHEIIGALRKVRCPEMIISLMYLIYRYIFLLLDMHRTMKEAATSRMGYGTLASRIRTTGNVYANLLARSYRQASVGFDAMESRGYDGTIRFYEEEHTISAGHIVVAAALLTGTAVMAVLLHG